MPDRQSTVSFVPQFSTIIGPARRDSSTNFQPILPEDAVLDPTRVYSVLPSALLDLCQASEPESGVRSILLRSITQAPITDSTASAPTFSPLFEPTPTQQFV